MIGARMRTCAAVLVALAAAPPAHAHLMPRQQGTVNVRDSAAFCVFSIPVSALSGWDRNADRRMSMHEFTLVRESIMRQLDAGITLHAGGDDGRRDFLQASLDLEDTNSIASDGATHLIVLLRQTFGSVPRDVRLGITLFGAAADERTFLIKATRGGAPEVAILDPSDPVGLFFPAHAAVMDATRWIGAQLPGVTLLGVLATAGMVPLLLMRRRQSRRRCASGY
jgi:hypothetical protein